METSADCVLPLAVGLAALPEGGVAGIVCDKHMPLGRYGVTLDGHGSGKRVPRQLESGSKWAWFVITFRRPIENARQMFPNTESQSPSVHTGAHDHSGIGSSRRNASREGNCCQCASRYQIRSPRTCTRLPLAVVECTALQNLGDLVGIEEWGNRAGDVVLPAEAGWGKSVCRGKCV